MNSIGETAIAKDIQSLNIPLNLECNGAAEELNYLASPEVFEVVSYLEKIQVLHLPQSSLISHRNYLLKIFKRIPLETDRENLNH
jgi:hypothetical protein